jgi:hypothetical protein
VGVGIVGARQTCSRCCRIVVGQGESV